MFNAKTTLNLRRGRQLDRIPTVGPSGVFTSWLGAYQAMRYGSQMIQEGYSKVCMYCAAYVVKYEDFSKYRHLSFGL